MIDVFKKDLKELFKFDKFNIFLCCVFCLLTEFIYFMVMIDISDFSTFELILLGILMALFLVCSAFTSIKLKSTLSIIFTTISMILLFSLQKYLILFTILIYILNIYLEKKKNEKRKKIKER